MNVEHPSCGLVPSPNNSACDVNGGEGMSLSSTYNEIGTPCLQEGMGMNTSRIRPENVGSYELLTHPAVRIEGFDTAYFIIHISSILIYSNITYSNAGHWTFDIIALTTMWSTCQLQDGYRAWELPSDDIGLSVRSMIHIHLWMASSLPLGHFILFTRPFQRKFDLGEWNTGIWMKDVHEADFQLEDGKVGKKEISAIEGIELQEYERPLGHVQLGVDDTFL
ncbi:hypothetical protein EDD18DRAFT_1107766 [Armillaria luteobubalina]|uniref:Uncharacterized protein n=1 Tax=Armillaria luteobubalina TaxID=153913 RepID=A0AA39UUT3_9AGAR|nr:hypothetical protein EDD18DRAFT_1107766 [Armillaria luteobubalina]